MFSQVFYLIRSRMDGQYLVARPKVRSGADEEQSSPAPAYLLMFKEHFDALSYLNTHGSGLANQFTVESMPGNQLGSLIKRWGFVGIGLVHDPLLPQVEFLQQESDR